MRFRRVSPSEAVKARHNSKMSTILHGARSKRAKCLLGPTLVCKSRLTRAVGDRNLAFQWLKDKTLVLPVQETAVLHLVKTHTEGIPVPEMGDVPAASIGAHTFLLSTVETWKDTDRLPPLKSLARHQVS